MRTRSLIVALGLAYAAIAQDALTSMVLVPAGTYHPLFRGKDAEQDVAVAAFELEIHAVTNAFFLAFVTAQPQWRRSNISPLFADARYLTHWKADLDPGTEALDRPVTNVSWFTARAYARWAGRRLPTIAEWEIAGAASETRADGNDNPAHLQRILDWYAKPAGEAPPRVRSTEVNFFGLHDLHGVVWEWVDDFDRVMTSGESRGGDGDAALYCGAGGAGSARPQDYAAFMRRAFRSSLQARSTAQSLGFRCAKSPGAESRATCCEALPAAAPPPRSASLHDLQLRFTDQSGEPRTFAALRGQATVLVMMFTHCAYACPRLVADLRALDARLPKERRSQVRFVLVSFDAERDLPERMRAYATARSLDMPRWTLWHTDAETVRELAGVLGVRYAREANGSFAHSNVITILDAKGVVATRLVGLGLDPEPALAALRGAR